MTGTKEKKKRIKEDIKERPNKQSERSLYKRYIPYICLVAVGVFFITVGIRELLTGQRESAAARDEYDQLQEVFEDIVNQETPVIDDDEEPAESVDEEEKEVERPPTLEELARMNRDFIGWISVKDLIEYPVVRGSDNEKYINTTFTGQQNTAGAIFMDYRHSNGFDETICILYGHHTWDGSMFAPLARYLDQSFLQRNPTITITKPDGKNLTYRIFAAKMTDAWDPAYTVGVSDTAKAAEVFPNVPANASRFMLLSTCTRSRNNDERIFVYAAAVS